MANSEYEMIAVRLDVQPEASWHEVEEALQRALGAFHVKLLEQHGRWSAVSHSVATLAGHPHILFLLHREPDSGCAGSGSATSV